ncbi:hypothetical protein SAMN05192534_11230 [Alteribacillus persepolensis]|uniref:Uncharacterized protein n=1 Tax=Alteribacillus persepolensis TaxID=568899 RepID=A0A1G8FGX9_9BACI|nr:hypothetical protein [Alteribacillus persepolensis]SDH81316.1 hypothetical protein SAMN05192534_11230 [Alteribacillus persepolensis]
MAVTIRRKKDIEEMLADFENMAKYDEQGQKHYFVFRDRQRGGWWTLMKTNNRWSVHGKGDNYCDIAETVLNKEEVLRFIWKNRSAVNQKRKSLFKEGVR